MRHLRIHRSRSILLTLFVFMFICYVYDGFALDLVVDSSFPVWEWSSNSKNDAALAYSVLLTLNSMLLVTCLMSYCITELFLQSYDVQHLFVCIIFIMYTVLSTLVDQLRNEKMQFGVCLRVVDVLLIYCCTALTIKAIGTLFSVGIIVEIVMTLKKNSLPSQIVMELCVFIVFHLCGALMYFQVYVHGMEALYAELFGMEFFFRFLDFQALRGKSFVVPKNARNEPFHDARSLMLLMKQTRVSRLPVALCSLVKLHVTEWLEEKLDQLHYVFHRLFHKAMDPVQFSFYTNDTQQSSYVSWVRKQPRSCYSVPSSFDALMPRARSAIDLQVRKAYTLPEHTAFPITDPSCGCREECVMEKSDTTSAHSCVNFDAVPATQRRAWCTPTSPDLGQKWVNDDVANRDTSCSQCTTSWGTASDKSPTPHRFFSSFMIFVYRCCTTFRTAVSKIFRPRPRTNDSSMFHYTNKVTRDTMDSAIRERLILFNKNILTKEVGGYRYVGLLGTPNANWLWKRLVTSAVYQDKVTLPRDSGIYYGLRGYLPFQRSTHVKYRTCSLSSMSSCFPDMSVEDLTTVLPPEPSHTVHATQQARRATYTKPLVPNDMSLKLMATSTIPHELPHFPSSSIAPRCQKRAFTTGDLFRIACLHSSDHPFPQDNLATRDAASPATRVNMDAVDVSCPQQTRTVSSGQHHFTDPFPHVFNPNNKPQKLARFRLLESLCQMPLAPQKNSRDLCSSTKIKLQTECTQCGLLLSRSYRSFNTYTTADLRIQSTPTRGIRKSTARHSSR